MIIKSKFFVVAILGCIIILSTFDVANVFLHSIIFLFFVWLTLELSCQSIQSVAKRNGVLTGQVQRFVMLSMAKYMRAHNKVHDVNCF